MLATRYVDGDDKLLLETDDGSDDVITVPDKYLNLFEYFGESYEKPGMSGVYDSQGFNDYWKVTIFGFEGTTIMNNFFSLFDSQWAKQNVIDFIQNQTYWNSFVMGASVALSQWKNLEKVTSGLSAGMAGLKFIKFLKSISKAAAKSSINITYLTKAGKYPSWSTVKARYWKVMNGGKVPTGTAKVKIRATGEIKNIKVSKELHHINGRKCADPHRFNNLKEVWPWEHQAIDPHRHIGYKFIEWVK